MEKCSYCKLSVIEVGMAMAKALRKFHRNFGRRLNEAVCGGCFTRFWQAGDQLLGGIVVSPETEFTEKTVIVPVLHGGGNHINNLQTLCKKCNSKKGSKQ
jgi:5-methylcytosine-specific restriction endonuclease McrA